MTAYTPRHAIVQPRFPSPPSRFTRLYRTVKSAVRRYLAEPKSWGLWLEAPDAGPVVLSDPEIAVLAAPSRAVEFADAMHAAAVPYMPASTLDKRRPLAGRAPYPVTATGELTRLPVVPGFMRQAVYGETCAANVLAGAYLP